MAFDKEIFEGVNNPEYTYYKIKVNNKFLIDEFIDELQTNAIRRKALEKIYALMDLYGVMQFPETKFRKILSVDREDVHEFKSKDLRVYVIVQKPNVYVVMGGIKKEQKKDIEALKHRIKDFPKE